MFPNFNKPRRNTLNRGGYHNNPSRNQQFNDNVHQPVAFNANLFQALPALNYNGLIQGMQNQGQFREKLPFNAQLMVDLSLPPPRDGFRGSTGPSTVPFTPGDPAFSTNLQLPPQFLPPPLWTRERFPFRNFSAPPKRNCYIDEYEAKALRKRRGIGDIFVRRKDLVFLQPDINVAVGERRQAKDELIEKVTYFNYAEFTVDETILQNSNEDMRKLASIVEKARKPTGTGRKNVYVWVCDMCKLFATSAANFTCHLLSKKHMKNAKMANLLTEPEKSSYHCQICNVESMDLNTYNGHMMSNQHRQNIVDAVPYVNSNDPKHQQVQEFMREIDENDAQPARKTYSCDTCHVKVNSVLQYEEHLKSKKHHKREMYANSKSAAPSAKAPHKKSDF